MSQKPHYNTSNEVSIFAKEANTIGDLSQSAIWKRDLLRNHPFSYILRGMMSSCFVGFVCMGCFVVGNHFYQTNPGVSYILASTLFSAALLMIVYGGGELFTSNIMCFTFALTKKRCSPWDVCKTLLFCYAANLAGAMLFGLLIRYTGIFDDGAATTFLHAVVVKKMSTGFIHVLIKGILCNWLVCLAVLLSGRVKSEASKIILIFMMVFCFFICGYEHSIANFSLFSISLLTPHSADITLMGAVHNIIPATIGNIIGGGVCMGLCYAFLNRSHVEKNYLCSEFTDAEKNSNAVDVCSDKLQSL